MYQSRYEVRKPNQTEKELIAQWIYENDNIVNVDYEVLMAEVGEVYDENTTQKQKIGCCLVEVENAFISVMVGYESSSPSYEGDIITIVWGECCFQTSLIYDKNKRRLIENELQ